jgi:ornithine carbamoyltransferase
MTRLLDIDDITPADFAGMLDTATAWKADPATVPALLAGKGAALLFEKPSARTRASTEMAVVGLGGHPIYVRAEEVGMGSRESVADVARTFAGFCAVIAARVHDHETLVEMADVAPVPVVNLLSDRAHPLQAVADFLTLRELLGDLEGRRLVYVGDGNNVAASLAYGAALTGVELTVATPPGYELDEIVVSRARNLGGVVELSHEPHEAVRGADALYTDVWTSMGQEEETAVRKVAFAGFTVDEELMAAAGEQAWFLHCLPAHRGEEVSAAVIDGPRSAVWQQAANRMDAARAALAFVLGGLGGGSTLWRCSGGAAGRPGRRNGIDPCDGDAVEARPDGRGAATESTRVMATLGKPQRQHRIAKMLEEQVISSQVQLVDMLAADGVVATQATVSRDLEELGAVKVRIPGGATAYAIPEHAKERPAPDDLLRRVMGEFVVEVAHSANLVVLRTPPGSAHVVASALDRAGLAEVLGTVAGDDTIILVTAEHVGGAAVAGELAALAGL